MGVDGKAKEIADLETEEAVGEYAARLEEVPMVWQEGNATVARFRDLFQTKVRGMEPDIFGSGNHKLPEDGERVTARQAAAMWYFLGLDVLNPNHEEKTTKEAKFWTWTDT